MRKWAQISWLLAAAFVTALVAASCSPKKNTAATRNYQAFITRYNVHYNGDLHYRETLEKMEREYDDDFTRLLPMHPAEARGDSKAPQPQGDFRRSIEKAQKAIQTRSIKKRPRRQPGRRNDPDYKEWLKREEYNPFLHNSWMLMARSQYMNGDFLPAAATFLYIANHFRWLPETVTEARIWQARCYCAAGWVNEAEATLARVKEKNLTDGKLTGEYNFVKADIALHRNDYEGAIAPLREAIAHSGGTQRIRLTYLLGQVCERAGRAEEARAAFSKAEGSASAPYRTRLNARISLSATLAGRPESETQKELKALRRMKRYDRNAQYLDQILYAEGNLLLTRGDTTGAMHAYAEAGEKSTRRGIEMALARLALGNLYFGKGDYDAAQPCYAEAVPMLPDDYAGIEKLRMRSDVLDELAVYSRNVALQDSLLRLADMPEEERLKVVDAIIARLKEAEEKERKEEERRELDARAENMESTPAINPANGTAATAPATFTMNTDKSWYFYNPTAKSAGSAEFRRRWGSRKQEDDWRRRNKNSYSPLTPDEGEEERNSPDSTSTIGSEAPHSPAGAASASDPHTREFYLKNIPADESGRQEAHAIIQEGLYNMGLILKDKLDDFAAARRQWNRLLSDYPDNIYRLDAYHNLYLMAAREGNMAEAERYRRLIASEFPESPEGVAMADPNYLENLKEMHSRQEQLYARTWEAYLADRNDSVRADVAYARQHYPMSEIMPKFLFLDALTYATEGDTEGFTSRLRQLVERYPDADVSPLAATWIRSAAEGRGVVSDGKNARGMIWTTRLTADGAGEEAALQTTDTVAVTLAPEAPRVVIMAFALDSVSANELLYEVARFNFSTFSVADFDLENLSFGPVGIIVVRPFANLTEAERYLRLMESGEGIRLPRGVVPAIIPERDFREITVRGLTLDDYFRAQEKALGQEVHESVLPPDEYPSPEEMYNPDESEQQ